MNTERLREYRNWFDKNVDQLDIDFDMSMWSTDEEEDVLPPNKASCGTSCCLLGFAAVWPTGKKVAAEDNFAETHDWPYFSDKLFGIASNDSIFEFLFGGEHPDSKEQALARIDTVLDLGKDLANMLVPQDEDRVPEFLEGLDVIRKKAVEKHVKESSAN